MVQDDHVKASERMASERKASRPETPTAMDHPESPKDHPESPPIRVVDRRWWAQAEAGRDAEEAGLRKPTYVEDLERRLADSVRQTQALTTDHRRALEEFEQVKLRMRREVSREVDRGRRGVFVELLEVLDNLDRAVDAARNPAASGNAESLLRGVELVREQLLARLEGFGVKRLDSLGEAFDPARHDAVTTTPVTDRRQHGIVMAVIKPSYSLNDNLLRPAAVVVGQSLPNADEPR